MYSQDTIVKKRKEGRKTLNLINNGGKKTINLS